MSDWIPPGKVYLTPKEAARYLAKAPGTLEEWRREKKGPRYYKLGPERKAAILYHRHDLDLWIAQFMVPTKDQK